MATLERLVATIAKVEGVDLARVRAIARSLRECDLIATGGRGTSAAEMSEKDAANLLIAVNVADTAPTAAEMVEQYRRLRASSNTSSGYFGTELEKLLSGAGMGEMANSVRSLVRLAPGRSPLLSSRYAPEEYLIDVKFIKPNSFVTIVVAAPRGETKPDRIEFFQRAESSAAISPDRIVEVRITERTIIGRWQAFTSLTQRAVIRAYFKE